MFPFCAKKLASFFCWFFSVFFSKIVFVSILYFEFPTQVIANPVNFSDRYTSIISLKSFKDIRDQNVIKQSFDYSCGTAALATILRFFFSENISEQDVLGVTFLSLSDNEELLKKKQGISLLDLQRTSDILGYRADGFYLLPEYLKKINRPVIVYIKPNGYEHFAVFKGIYNDRVYLADPSLGNIRMPVYRFLNMWINTNGKGVVFVMEKKDEKWIETNFLRIPEAGLPQPEILSIREMLRVGNPYIRYPNLLR